MSVMTRLYENYAEASRVVAEVERLNIQGVDASILGGDSLHDDYRNRPYRDPATYVDVDTRVDVEDEARGVGTGASVGAVVGGGAGLLAGLGILAIPGIGPLVAAGWLAATAVGAIGGAAAGGAVGALVDLGIGEEEAPVYSESFRRGGVAVSVRFPEDARSSIESALSRVPAQALPNLRRRFEAEGWRPEETDAEREARLARLGIPPRKL